MRIKTIVLLSLALFAVATATASARQVGNAARSSAVPPSSNSAGVGGVGASGNGGDPSPSGGSLPFTGIDLRVAIVAGAVLILGGAALRRRVRSSS